MTSAVDEQKMPKESGIDQAFRFFGAIALLLLCFGAIALLLLCFGAIALLGFIVSCLSLFEVLVILCFTILMNIEDSNTEDEQVTSAVDEQKMPKKSGIYLALKTFTLFLCFGANALLFLCLRAITLPGYIGSCLSLSVVLTFHCFFILMNKSAVEQKMPKESGMYLALKTLKLSLCFEVIALPCFRFIALLGYIVSCLSLSDIWILCFTTLMCIYLTLNPLELFLCCGAIALLFLCCGAIALLGYIVSCLSLSVVLITLCFTMMMMNTRDDSNTDHGE